MKVSQTGAGPQALPLANEPTELSVPIPQEQGIEPERDPYRVREGGSLICYVQDPDGYRIELTTAIQERPVAERNAPLGGWLAALCRSLDRLGAPPGCRNLDSAWLGLLCHRQLQG
jgi:hypothetical protein